MGRKAIQLTWALQNWIGRKTNPIQRYLRVSVTLQSFGV